MKLTNNAKILLETRYFQPGETWTKLSKRVAKAIARVEKTPNLKKKWEDQFVSIIDPGEFIPASPFMMNSGISDHYFSCYVLPIEDSLTSIYETIANAARIFQGAGGCGYSFSKLRPQGCTTSKNPLGRSSGPLSFMHVFDASCKEIVQGGCVPEGTRVTLADGLRVKIENLCPSSEMINMHSNTPLEIEVANDLGGPQLTSTFFNNGNSDVISLHTHKGFEFTATPTHKIRVINSNGEYIWKELKEIVVDDWVALKGNTSKCLFNSKSTPLIDAYKSGHGNEKDIKVPLMWTKDLSKFLGFWFGDGFYTNSGIGFSISGPEIYDEYATLGYELFGIEPKYGKSREGDASWFLYFHSNALLKWLKYGIKLTHEEIPEDIQSNDHVAQLSFMRGWFDADGSISKDGYPSLSSCRQQVIKDAQKILLALGILSSSRCQIRSNSFTDGVQYHLTISGDRSRFMYYDYIGFTRTLLKNQFCRKDKHHNTSDIYPNQREKIKSWLTDSKLVGQRISKGKANGKMSKSLYKSFERFVHRGINLSRARITALISQYPEELQTTWLKEWAEGDLYFDKISTIYTGKAQTYDIEVPGTRTYIADGWVSHNSRKGAQMGVLRIDHPDIEAFIDSKQDLTNLTQFNISVAITRAFMDAVRDDTEFKLVFEDHPEQNKTVQARDLWKKIIHNAWKTGDPGLLFIDEINDKDSIGKIDATNPCYAEGTLVSHERGLIPIEEIKEGDKVYVGNGKFETVEKFFDIGNRDVLHLTIKGGYTIIVTPDQEICTPDNGIILVKDMKVGDAIVLQQDGQLPTGGNYTDGLLAGLICGDGSFSSERLQMTFNLRDKNLVDTEFIPLFQKRFETTAKTFTRTQRSGNDIYRWNCGKKDALEFGRKYSTKTSMAPATLTEGVTFIKGYIEGLFYADGHIENSDHNNSIGLTSVHKKFLQDLQILLLQFSIRSSIYTSPRASHESDSKYDISDKDHVSYRLQIMGVSKDKFIDIFKFYSPKMSSLIKKSTRPKAHQNTIITQIEQHKNIHVYDFKTDGDRKVYTNGIYTRECGEQPLPPYSCCDLGSINLARMITKKGDFDWERFAEVIHIAVRFLDNAIEGNNYTLTKIKEQQLGERRIGLGIMGLADALIDLEIPYDSDEARHWAEAVAIKLDEETKIISEKLAKEKGAFPFQSKSRLDKDIPIRNATRTTIAPCGSISIVAGCSSSIEPLFALAFTRKHDIAEHPELTEVNSAFQQAAITGGFYTEKLMQKILENNGSCQGLSEVPKDIQKIFKVSADLYPADHVKMLSTWQKHIQSGVSKTINLSESATKDDIEKVFWQSFESKCKGITVFRDKCRGDQVLNYGPVQPKGRPEYVPGGTTKVNTALGKMYITVNNLKNGEGENPFEVFIQISKGGTNAQADGEAIARLVSLALRSKVSVAQIVEQLKGIGAGEIAFNQGRAISSIPDAVAYVLETRFMENEEKIEHPDDHDKYFPSGSSKTRCKDCD